MTHDAPDSELARLLAWRPRQPADAAGPAELASLLEDLGSLRLSLSADMGLLASAVEMKAYDIAAEVVEGERHDLAAFGARAGARLEAAAADEPAETDGPAERGTGARRSRRLRALVPAAPALVAAAALVGVLAGIAPGGTAPPSGTTSLDAAAASYAQLYRLHERGASESTLLAASYGLHAEVARVMALASSDPQRAEAALRLLASEVTSVEDDDERADLRAVLAESQRLLAVLEAAVAGAVSETTGALPGSPTDPVTPRPVPLPAPQLAEPAPEPQRASAQPSTTPSPSAPEQPSADGTDEPEPSPEGAPSEVLPGDSITGGTRSILPPPGED